MVNRIYNRQRVGRLLRQLDALTNVQKHCHLSGSDAFIKNVHKYLMLHQIDKTLLMKEDQQ
jgi:hypothetical protein